MSLKELFVKHKNYKRWDADKKDCFFEDFQQVSKLVKDDNSLFQEHPAKNKRFLPVSYGTDAVSSMSEHVSKKNLLSEVSEKEIK